MNRMTLIPKGFEPAISAISPRQEMGSYEALWQESGATWKTMAERFAADPEALPSDFVEPERARQAADEAIRVLSHAGVSRFGIRINKAGDYPEKLRDARHPVELLYYQGTWEIAELPSIAVVGSRKATVEGRARAARLSRELVGAGFAVASGLAAGIDTAALTAAIDAGGHVAAVIGTPLSEAYPRENADLQKRIAREHLLVSQIPVLRYQVQPFATKRHYFPERNATMSALTLGTVIVEAGETSGTLTQARAALYQGRKLFIMESCFTNPAITWPAYYEARGAIRVRSTQDVIDALA